MHTHIGEYEKHWGHEWFAAIGSRGARGISVADYKKMFIFNPDKYIAGMDEAGINISVILGIDATRFSPNAKTPIDYIHNFIKKYPERIMAFAGGQAVDSGGRFSIRSLDECEKAVKEYGFKGFKLLPSYSHYYPNDKACYPFYQKAEELGIPVLLHMGTTPLNFANMEMGRPVYLDDVAMDFPDLKICAAHLAYPWTQELYGLMRKCPNVYADISANLLRPTILAWNLVMAKDYNLMDRVMFGSEWPFVNRKNFVELCRTGINQIAEKSGWQTLSNEEIEGLLGKNAMNFLGLK